MARYKKAENPYVEKNIDGEECVVFKTEGKVKVDVIVDKRTWFEYLKDYSWTGIQNGKRIDVKTSIDKQSKTIWRIIVEHEYDELDYWGTTIDHINNNPLDNRLANLRIFNAAILNCTNISSKYKKSDMQYIHRQGPKDRPSGYKVHYNLGGETFYKNFSMTEFGDIEGALKAAKKYRDEVVVNQRQVVIDAMLRKTRNIEFERGLKCKLESGELDDVLLILKKYNVINDVEYSDILKKCDTVY